MAENWFADNYADLSVQGGVNAGFQFEFRCERCQDAYRTRFQGYAAARAAGWLGQASGLIGGLLGQGSDAAGQLADAGWRKAWDGAFQNAAAEAKASFHRCARCFQMVCGKCFHEPSGLCFNCAPDAEVEMEAAKAMGKAMGASEVGQAAGYEAGKSLNAEKPRQLVCPKCGSETHGAKFCPECGEKLAVQAACPDCGHASPPGTKFCPECGAKMAG